MRFVFFVLFAGCGPGGATLDDGGGAEADAEGDADTDADADSDSDADTDADPGDCGSWLVTYDLTGTTFFIETESELQPDFEIIVREPYEEDHNMGPGHIVVRFPDVGGAPGVGGATITEYFMDWNFVAGAPGLADVSTDILNESGPEACGVATGTLTGVELPWSPAELTVCQNGTISCEGPVCGQFGTPEAGSPTVITDDCEPQPLQPWTFSADLTTFEMEAVLITDEEGTQTAMNFRGTQTSAVLDPATPACACP